MEILKDFVRLLFGINENDEVTTKEVVFVLAALLFLIVVVFGLMR